MIYLDSAATTLEKPPSVSRSMRYALQRSASPGRGGYSAGLRAAEIMYRCRELASELFDVPDPQQVVLTFNATHGLNIAIRTLVHPGAVVLISGYEHNAVTRVLQSIPDIDVRIAAGSLFDGNSVYQAFESLMTEDVDVVICNHVSNVFGFILPMDRIAELCRERGKHLIIDASQSAGTLPISLKQLGAAFIAMPGHKGLYGPQGTGLLLCGEMPAPIMFGGTGSESINQKMPDDLPDRLEPGTPNVCGVSGLAAGMHFVRQTGIDNIFRHERSLCRSLADRIAKIHGLHVFRGCDQSGLFSFLIEGKDCEEIGEKLGRKGIAVRTGLHCAPLAHRTAGTLETGTVRVSFSAFSCMAQLDRIVHHIIDVAH